MNGRSPKHLRFHRMEMPANGTCTETSTVPEDDAVVNR
jgi:hypothetical protein